MPRGPELDAILVAAMILVPLASGSQKPVTIVYSGPDTRIAEALASIIRQDERFADEILLVSSPSAVTLATILPTTRCIVIYSDHRNDLLGLGYSLKPFFDLGGGLVGMRDICYEPSAGNLSKEVFPVHGNSSVMQTSTSTKRVRTYVAAGESEITLGLPGRFGLPSMGTYLSADVNGTYVQIPGDYQALYTDHETGSPLVLAFRSQAGGRSVALPGIWVVKTPRVDVYYGALMEDANFTRLLTNSVLWAAEGTRFNRVMDEISSKLEGVEEEKIDLRNQAQAMKRRDRNRRLLNLALLWALGLAACAAIGRKLVLVRVEE